jgi:ankyrin repeat protein
MYTDTTTSNYAIRHVTEIPRDLITDIIIRSNGSRSLQQSCRFFKETYDNIMDHDPLTSARILYNVVIDYERNNHSRIGGAYNNIDALTNNIIDHFPNNYMQIFGSLLTIILLEDEHDDSSSSSLSYLSSSSVYVRNLLIWASWEGHTDIVKLLLEDYYEYYYSQGADISDALRSASSHGRTLTVQLLLDRGADAAADDGCCAALIWASGSGHRDTVQLLLDRGADVHSGGDQALCLASSSGHTATVELLLDRGADVNAQNGYALRWASTCGHTATVELLLDRGAGLHADNDPVILKQRKCCSK